MTALGVVTGTAAEARCLPRPGAGLAVAIAGADAGRAEAAATRLIASGAGMLISIGVAGGLAPDLAPGTVILASEIIAPDGVRHVPSPGMRAALAAAFDGPPPLNGALAGSDDVVASVAAKRALFAATGALAVDTESHAVAAVATRGSTPFAALRVVVDPAERALPRAALVAVGADGALRPFRLLAALCRRPSDLSALVALGGEWRLARSGLTRAGLALSGLFGGGGGL